jgi:hypothetical protein
MRKMKPLLEIELPYPKPLTIAVGISTSTKSWGDCEGRPWPEPLPPALQAAANAGNMNIRLGAAT